MPTSTPERRERWGIDSDKAQSFLEGRGYKLTRKWTWLPPTPSHQPSKEEMDAIIFLIEEWDYGGLERPKIDLDALDAAIAVTLGAEVDKAMREGRVGRTTRHRQACERAFAYKMEGEHVELLRAALVRLMEEGSYL